MKVITMFSGKEHVVADDEAENVAQASTMDGLIHLRNGNYINPKGIECIGEPPKKMYYKGYPVDNQGLRFIRDGVWIGIENPDNIEYLENPKYNLLLKALPNPVKQIA